MALANIGVHLGKDYFKLRPHSVLLIDWDLDAPGLAAFFNQLGELDATTKQRPGLLEYFETLREMVIRNPEFYAELTRGRASLEDVVRLEDFVVANASPGVDLMMAGSMDTTYSARVSRFDWSSLWEKYPALITAFRNLIAEKYPYVLIDSRTGFNDISGLCTAIMPEKLVVMFAPNLQNLEGVVRIARTSVRYRKESDDVRPLSVFPLASRIDGAEFKERRNLLTQSGSKWTFVLQELYNDPGCNLTGYFRDIFIPYVPFYAYGEKLAFEVEESDDPGLAGSLRRAYEDFARKLTCLDYAWQDEREALRNRTEAGLAQRE
jgi:hypothetical protein